MASAVTGRTSALGRLVRIYSTRLLCILLLQGFFVSEAQAQGGNTSPGVTVSETMLDVAELNGTITYTIVLQAAPTGNVTITPRSQDTDIATVSPEELTFTPDNWNTPQTVTLRGVDDALINEPARQTTVTHTIEGGGYNNVTVADVTVTATDDDEVRLFANVIFLSFDEAGRDRPGERRYYRVRLSGRRPTHNVVVTPVPVEPMGVTVSPERLTFTPDNWNISQEVTVMVADDDIDNPDNFGIPNIHTLRIVHMVESNDEEFGRLTPGTTNNQSASGIVLDNDVAGLTLSRTSLDLDEGSGDVETYTIVLNTEPLDPITVTLTRMVDNENSFIVGPMQLIFTPSNWDEPQEVRVLDRSESDEIDTITPRTNSINHTVSGPQNSPYNSVTATLSVNTIDDDSPRP